MKITDYYLEERYSFTVPSELTAEEIKNSLRTAKKMIGRILSLIDTK